MSASCSEVQLFAGAGNGWLHGADACRPTWYWGVDASLSSRIFLFLLCVFMVHFLSTSAEATIAIR